MLKRVLEPEVMDTAEEAADYDAMDHSAVNQKFVEDLLATNPSPNEDDRWEVLDLGCGTAQQPIVLCEQFEDAYVIAFDLSIEMLELARFNVEAAGLVERIQLMHGDAKQMDFEDDMFAAVISNSIIHHIPEPLAVLQETVRVAAPGALLFFRDLLRPTSEAELNRLVAEYAGDESDHAQELFRASLHAALTVEEMADLVESLGFSRESVNPTSDRHWTWLARKREDS